MRSLRQRVVHDTRARGGGTPVMTGALQIAAGSLMLAPIAGYTDSPFRAIARAQGAGLTVTELVSAEGIVRMNRKTAALLAFSQSERPLAIQIFGSSPAVMGEAAAAAAALGPDMIDINMGCPARRVCASGAGAAIVRDPDLTYRIADAVVRSTRDSGLPVSAKIRIGWDRDTLTYRETVGALEAAGISMLVVHGRTRAQQYSGLADWNIIAEICAMTSVPVIGNGDITTHEDALSRMKSSGCAGVMIGRGALGNPWIFSGARPDIGERISLMKSHFDAMIDFYGDMGMVLMRKHLVHYLTGIHGARAFRRGIVTATAREEVFRLLDDFAAASGERSQGTEPA